MEVFSQSSTFNGQRDAVARGMSDQALGNLRQMEGKKLPQDQVRKVAEDFESMFLGQMLQHMFENVESPEMFDGGHAEEMYKSLLTDEYAKMLSQRGGIGIADHIEREMLKLQESGQ